MQFPRLTARKSTAPYSGRNFPEPSRRTPCQFPTWLIIRPPSDGSHDYHMIVRCGSATAATFPPAICQLPCSAPETRLAAPASPDQNMSALLSERPDKVGQLPNHGGRSGERQRFSKNGRSWARWQMAGSGGERSFPRGPTSDGQCAQFGRSSPLSPLLKCRHSAKCGVCCSDVCCGGRQQSFGCCRSRGAKELAGSRLCLEWEPYQAGIPARRYASAIRARSTGRCGPV